MLPKFTRWMGIEGLYPNRENRSMGAAIRIKGNKESKGVRAAPAVALIRVEDMSFNLRIDLGV